MKLQLAIVIFGLIVSRNAFAAEVDRAALLAEAIKAAGQIQDRDARAEALIEIAADQARVGDVTGARRTVNDLAGLRNKELACNQIAVRCAEAGDVNGARSMLDLVSDDVVKSAIYRSIAYAKAQKGDVAATKAAAKLVTEAFKADADAYVVLAQIKAGDMKGTEAAAASIVGADSVKVEVLVEIALAQSKSNDPVAAAKTIARAQKLTETISDPLRPLPLIAGAQTKLGDLPGAMATAQRGRDDGGEKSLIYSFIAEAQLGMNNIPAAKATIAKARDQGTQIDFLCRLALAQTKSRDATGATQSLDAAKLVMGKLAVSAQSMVCSRIASTQTEISDSAGAIAWARSLKDPGIRTRALCGVVAGLVTMDTKK